MFELDPVKRYKRYRQLLLSGVSKDFVLITKNGASVRLHREIFAAASPGFANSKQNLRVDGKSDIAVNLFVEHLNGVDVFANGELNLSLAMEVTELFQEFEVQQAAVAGAQYCLKKCAPNEVNEICGKLTGNVAIPLAIVKRLQGFESKRMKEVRELETKLSTSEQVQATRVQNLEDQLESMKKERDDAKRRLEAAVKARSNERQTLEGSRRRSEIELRKCSQLVHVLREKIQENENELMESQKEVRSLRNLVNEVLLKRNGQYKSLPNDANGDYSDIEEGEIKRKRRKLDDASSSSRVVNDMNSFRCELVRRQKLENVVRVQQAAYMERMAIETRRGIVRSTDDVVQKVEARKRKRVVDHGAEHAANEKDKMILYLSDEVKNYKEALEDRDETLKGFQKNPSRIILDLPEFPSLPEFDGPRESKSNRRTMGENELVVEVERLKGQHRDLKMKVQNAIAMRNTLDFRITEAVSKLDGEKNNLAVMEKLVVAGEVEIARSLGRLWKANIPPEHISNRAVRVVKRVTVSCRNMPLIHELGTKVLDVWKEQGVLEVVMPERKSESIE